MPSMSSRKTLSLLDSPSAGSSDVESGLLPHNVLLLTNFVLGKLEKGRTPDEIAMKLAKMEARTMGLALTFWTIRHEFKLTHLYSQLLHSHIDIPVPSNMAKEAPMAFYPFHAPRDLHDVEAWQLERGRRLTTIIEEDVSCEQDVFGESEDDKQSTLLDCDSSDDTVISLSSLSDYSRESLVDLVKHVDPLPTLEELPMPTPIVM